MGNELPPLTPEQNFLMEASKFTKDTPVQKGWTNPFKGMANPFLIIASVFKFRILGSDPNAKLNQFNEDTIRYLRSDQITKLPANALRNIDIPTAIRRARSEETKKALAVHLKNEKHTEEIFTKISNNIDANTIGNAEIENLTNTIAKLPPKFIQSLPDPFLKTILEQSLKPGMRFEGWSVNSNTQQKIVSSFIDAYKEASENKGNSDALADRFYKLLPDPKMKSADTLFYSSFLTKEKTDHHSDFMNQPAHKFYAKIEDIARKELHNEMPKLIEDYKNSGSSVRKNILKELFDKLPPPAGKSARELLENNKMNGAAQLLEGINNFIRNK